MNTFLTLRICGLTRFTCLTIGCVAFLVAIKGTARAGVTNVAWYRLGENDPGAASGLAVTNTTTDFIGSNHLKQYGSPLYTDDVSAGASSGAGSVLAVNFNGSDQYLSNAVVSTAVNNFGIEAWVKPNNINAGVYFIADNGFAAGGWGIYQNGGGYFGLFGGVAIFGNGTASPGTWAHVALVRDNGTSTLYVNGIPTGTTASAPNPATGGFAIGTPPQAPTSSFFNGVIDEVRVFTFAPGQFSTSDLLFTVRVATLAATGFTATSATLNGSVNPAGLPTSAWFEWGTTTNYGNVTPPQAFGSGTGGTNFSQLVSATSGGVTYHFRAVASNSLGLVSGTNQSFTVPIFYNIGAGLTGVGDSGGAWGDYDNDGSLDILLTGWANNVRISQLWRNTGNSFSNINATFENQQFTSAAWGDYNNDERLDLLLGGNNFTELWRNTGNGFTNAQGPNTGFSGGVMAWGDYDNDGRLDILTGGTSGFRIMRNTGSGFILANVGLPTSFSPNSVAWGDYDNDGQLDILFSSPPPFGNSGVLRNTGSGFTNINSGLPGLYYSSAAWGDYDADGRLDILLAGSPSINGSTGLPTTTVAQVWRNTGSGFTNINAGLPGVALCSVAWGDYDNDGRLDILLSGTNNTAGPITQVWRNTGSGFTNINAGLPGVYYGAAAWGDCDNDGRLDIVLMGFDASSQPISQVWRNATAATNSTPTAPSGLQMTVANQVATLNWNASSDDQTPAAGLSYNVRIGTAPGGADVLSPMSAASGVRRLPQRGNAQARLFAMFNYTLDRPYYWSVQAVDTTWAGSAFAPEQNFRILQPPPTVVTATVSNLVSGDLNGDGLVDQNELDIVLSNYWPYSPWLYMTNVAGLGGTNVTFALSNSTAGAFSVEYTTNLVDWQLLGPAPPRYEFTDTNAPAVPQRYYRLRWL